MADATKVAGKVRVMVVDDSAVIRGLLARALESEPAIEVVASVQNGEVALSRLAREDLDVVILDIEMPVMDGLTALPKLIALKPDIKVIMASTLTRKNAEVSLRALRLGAADYLAKPSSTSELSSAGDFKHELVRKVIALSGARTQPKPAAAPDGSARPATARPATARPATARPAAGPQGPVALRATALFQPDAIAIASSTGGPQALLEFLGNLGGPLRQPVLITQHMPPTFTTLLAEHIGRAAKIPCHEGVDGEAVTGGTIYVAPGGRHMTVERAAEQVVIRLNDDPPENYCRPSADPMFRSLAKIYGSRLLAVVLTGMGSDGKLGAEAITAAGGSVIAQDEASSVVWGMPGAVATAGLCSAVLPLTDIAPAVRKLVMRTAA